MDEDFNIGELMKFLRENAAQTRNPRTRQFYFNAEIVYHHHGSQVARFKTEVSVPVDAHTGGRITLFETKECPSDKFHLQFKARFDAMHYDPISKALIISGDSSKMGPYKVAISALSPYQT